jgi:Polyketide cyclase / dehydrase and lipid transport
MANWKEQALIQAPVQRVWDLVGDPNRHPEWFPMVMAVSGLPEVAVDAAYVQVSKGVGKARETRFLVEELDDMREIGVRCTDTGTYVHILLTPARDDTFAEIDIGFEPTSLMVRAVDATVGKRYCKRWTEDALDGLRAAVNRPAAT